MKLPIHDVLPELQQRFTEHANVVLQAPPGAGKTTCVPPALLEAVWLNGQKIIMLEPRRLAARAAATFMARQLGEDVGQTVGYRVRMDSRVGPNTRIEVVTEGVLTRMLQHDPSLEGIGIVIFDEFHERSLQADLGLALCLETQSALRDDLKLLVMSATLDGEPVARLMGDAPIITSEGRSFPVDIRHLTFASRGRKSEWLSDVMSTILQALKEEHGSLLVFLPGAGEIRRLETMLQAQVADDSVVIAPLYGLLSQQAQDLAISPTKAGQRKVVLATNIAETSLTIEGIRVVIDSGLMREPRFDPNSGMTRLQTVNISQASATQRSGRAGRLEAGVCYRLWPQGQHLLPFNAAEIETADLAPLALELANWGTRPEELAWLTPPPKAVYQQASELLQSLGALGADGRISSHGRAMAELPMHPRLAHMVLKANVIGMGDVACDVAALLSERDVLRRNASEDEGVDLHRRLAVLRRSDRHGGNQYSGDASVDRGAVQRVRDVAKQWRTQLGVSRDKAADDGFVDEMLGVLLAWAYPDRIGKRRSDSRHRYVLSNGCGAHLLEHDPLQGSDYLVAAQLDGAARDARIFLAASVSEQRLRQYFEDQIEERDVVEWDARAECIQAQRQVLLGALVLAQKPLEKPDADQLAQAMLDGIRAMGLACLPWSKALRQWQQRVQFLHRHMPEEWPDVSDEALLKTAAEWLAPFLNGISRKSHLSGLDLAAALGALLPWDKQQQLDALAPTHWQVPSGSKIAIDYDNDPPILAVKLQEMFGATDTPRIANGRVAVVLHLLSPAQRPVQVTQDLAGFWSSSYHDVKKEMKGRYPKHYWPDDPLQAMPTRHAKPRK